MNNENDSDNEGSSDGGYQDDNQDDNDEKNGFENNQPREINVLPVVEDESTSDEESNNVEPIRDTVSEMISDVNSNRMSNTEIDEEEACIRDKENESTRQMLTVHEPEPDTPPLVRNPQQGPTRLQPKRKVKSRDNYRRYGGGGSSNYQEEGKTTKNIGTQYFQRTGGNWSKGYRTLKSKYVEAASFLSKQINCM